MPNHRNDRLRIGTVSAGNGRIGMTFCPGKKQKGGASGDHNRDLQDDLRQVVDWGASSVVSVIEESELTDLHVPDLGKKAESLGLDWYLLPVPDGQVPGPDFESLWVDAGHRLRRALSKGQSILIHCKGGLGRTGTVAARLLIELGDSPEAAIAKIRAARPGAIETTAQERYVRRCTRIQPDD